MAKILIADDHMIVRKGIVFLCSAYCKSNEIDEVEKGSELMSALKLNSYTHLILDLVLGDGQAIKIIPAIRDLYPALSIMIFSAQPLEMYYGPLSKYGIAHFVAKHQSELDTLVALRQFINNLTQPGGHKFNRSSSNLSAREVEVVNYLLNGYKNCEIAAQMHVTRATVSVYIKRIRNKTGAKNVIQLKQWASDF